MLWFDGSIKNAIDRVKSSGVTLIVLVQGKDELSQKYESFLNEQVHIEPKNYVALKICDASIAFKLFKEIYVSVSVPSVFLIKSNGIPIKVVSSKKIDDIYTAISDVFGSTKYALSLPNNVNDGKKEKERPQANEKFIPKGVSKSVCGKNIGYKLFDISEEDIKKRLREIRAFPRFLLIDNPLPDPGCHSPTIPRIQSARLQFRLPNNDVPSWEFPDMSTLGDVRAYLAEQMNLSSDFKLLRAYPRSCFTPEDEGKTLIDLSLTPNATLIVVPIQDKTVQVKAKNAIVHKNILSVAIHALIQPVFVLINYFKKYILKIEEKKKNNEIHRLPSDTGVGKNLNKKTSTGNFHGFNFDEENDNEGNHSDNGNSTQQHYQE